MRQENETFEEFKARLEKEDKLFKTYSENKKLKLYLSGRFVVSDLKKREKK